MRLYRLSRKIKTRVKSAAMLGCLLAMSGLPTPAASQQPPTPAPQERGVAPLASSAAVTGADAHFYALVIGISGYQQLPQLQTPINDAKDIASILQNQYGFTTELLSDATRDQIIGQLDHYRRTLGENDELLVYYAGHGYYDKDINQAYWAPVDAGKDSYARWIIATEITGTAKAVPARHVLIISDSCYSGMLTRDAGVTPESSSEDRRVYLEKMSERKSRHVMSSGGDEPVQDSDAPGGVANHSVFANVLLQNLADSQWDTFTAEELFSEIKEQVGGRSQQVPEYSPIRDSSHDGGDFVFHRVAGKTGDAHPLMKTVELSSSQPTTAQAVTRSVAPPPDPEKEAIRATLDKYEDAYDSMDMQLMKEVWPTLSRSQEKALKDAEKVPGLKAVKVQLRNVRTTRDGDTARVKCDQWMVYTWVGRRQPPQTNTVEILLSKNQQGTWLVNDVKAR
jgi:hypothetical protein